MSDESPNTCSYPISSGKPCGKPVNAPHDEEHCIFHAPSDEKGISGEEFNKLIFEQIERASEGVPREDAYNFEGYVFPVEISFAKNLDANGPSFIFGQIANFRKAQFFGGANFLRVRFSDEANFHGAKFFSTPDPSGREQILFQDARFHGKADFSNAKFYIMANFRNAVFAEVSFEDSRFRELILFHGTTFEGISRFDKAKFKRSPEFQAAEFSKLASFVDARFWRGAIFKVKHFSGVADFRSAKFCFKVDFQNTQFDDIATFLGATFSGNADFSFISFAESSKFYFREVRLKAHKSKPTKIVFDKVIFKPFTTYFEEIPANGESEQNVLDKPVIIFRYCELKDVYFVGNDLSIFSFYKSSFDAARFSSNAFDEVEEGIFCRKKRWPSYKRKNTIFEERIFEHLDNEVKGADGNERIRDWYILEDLRDRDEIASLYRRMKTALDNTKDYEQSGWFYFNEFEMKRLALIDEHRKQGKFKFYVKALFSKRSLYYWYKVLSGYGEKPLWSFVWFAIFTIVFGIAHMLNGFKIRQTNVDPILINIGSSMSFWEKLGYSLLFSINRVIPISYLPNYRSEFLSEGMLGFLLSFLNSIMLTLFVILTAIGLKRHFRRF